jgi:predicted  nucleic acid-binding Zn-ribbon protein
LYLCGMGTDFQQRLARIRGRVVEVVRENVSLKTENLALVQELEELKKTIALQKNALAELKDENKLIKLAKEMSMSGSDVHDLKIKINELVKDIDRCIDLLNE